MKEFKNNLSKINFLHEIPNLVYKNIIQSGETIKEFPDENIKISLEFKVPEFEFKIIYYDHIFSLRDKLPERLETFELNILYYIKELMDDEY